MDEEQQEMDEEFNEGPPYHTCGQEEAKARKEGQASDLMDGARGVLQTFGLTPLVLLHSRGTWIPWTWPEASIRMLYPTNRR